MSDYGAFAGAQMIAEYLSIRDFMNGLDRNRANAQLSVDNALLNRDAEQLVVRYNELVAEFNDLLGRATDVAAEAGRKDAVIAGLQLEAEELRNGKAALEAECERLRRENTGQSIRIQWLSDMVRQDRPGYLPDC
jgi:FtsZ-binding cell division protein ZapB